MSTRIASGNELMLVDPMAEGYTVVWSGAQEACCDKCGALVGNPRLHTAWHEHVSVTNVRLSTNLATSSANVADAALLDPTSATGKPAVHLDRVSRTLRAYASEWTDE